MYNFLNKILLYNVVFAPTEKAPVLSQQKNWTHEALCFLANRKSENINSLSCMYIAPQLAKIALNEIVHAF
jgi:hypothetical protein